MHVKAFRVKNFRRLKDVRVDLDQQTTVFVGANNSGKTSATHLFQLFLGEQRNSFSIHDFTADCWPLFDQVGDTGQDEGLPTIDLDLWFDVDEENVHRVIDLLPDLNWVDSPVGVRLRYAPRDSGKLIEGYRLARQKATEGAEKGSSYRPWPQNLTDYLRRRISREYEITYYVLDYSKMDDDLRPLAGYEPSILSTNSAAAAKIVNSIIRVDFLNAQRHLTDAESSGRYEDLSKRLGRFYARNLEQREDDIEALGAIAESEDRLNAHYADAFRPMIDSLNQLGYPGLGNHELVVKATVNAIGLLNGSARVHYALPRDDVDDNTAHGPMLPDHYNGLGFKNLIFMVIEMLDFHYSWTSADTNRQPVHLVMIEEPEAHLHAQLQQVFIRKILDILPSPGAGFCTQLVVTTHSSHILYERSFQSVRYFRRTADMGPVHCSEVRNLSVFYNEEERATREFLLQYLKLTHCDLFFADAAVLVEGNVERLLLPLMIQKDFRELRARHLTILEVGGAFAYKFENLLKFLQLPTLIITDLDSVSPGKTPAAADDDGTLDSDEDEQDAGEGDGSRRTACRSDTPGAVTSNETLRQWIPQLEGVTELLAASASSKTAVDASGKGLVRVVYQTARQVEWQGERGEHAGRTLEEAFAFENLAWSQHKDQKLLQLRVRGNGSASLDLLKTSVFKKVRNLDKTKFALALMAAPPNDWTTPAYISEGLEWLRDTLRVEPDEEIPEVSVD